MNRQDHYRELKKIDIRDYARHLGYTVVRKGRYFSLKEHDSVRIDPDKNCFWRNSKPGSGGSLGLGGSVIDFDMEFAGTDKKQALQRLEKYAGSLDPGWQDNKPPTVKTAGTAKKLELPDPAPDMKRVFAYLVKTRKIHAGIVKELVQRKQLYQDIHGNCVFVSYLNGTPVFACRRGTSTTNPFYGDVRGCDYDQCFHISYGADRLYVTESVIDALSVMTLRENYKEWNYLAMAGGWKWNAIQSHMGGIREVWIGTDQDHTGRDVAEQIASWVTAYAPETVIVYDLPAKKDWNEVLTGGILHDIVCGKS